jgi:hypothetical protein
VIRPIPFTTKAGQDSTTDMRTEKGVLTLAGALLAILLSNRFLVSSELSYQQEQTDILAVVAIAGLVLNSLTAVDVTSKVAESVTLEGVRGRGLSPLILTGYEYFV